MITRSSLLRVICFCLYQVSISITYDRTEKEGLSVARVKSALKQEITLFAALAAALASCFFVPPDRAYLKYIDFRTLALLYCLMVVVSGLRGAGALDAFAHRLCAKAKTLRSLCFALVALCFFSSMLITNDVALLTFVPLATAVLSLAGATGKLAWVVVLQTVAANLGSMLTPMGNPQNLYLYSYYNMGIGEFFAVTAPVWLVCAALLALLCLRLPRTAAAPFREKVPACSRKRLAFYSVLFLVCLLVVLRVIAWPVMLAVVLLSLLASDRKMLLRADFCLLLTFVGFFVFAGNMARIGAVDGLIRSRLSGNELLGGAALSQVTSNVPAAMLLAGFTDKAGALLLGVDIGGLGTPVASLASLISLKLYSGSAGAETGRYIKLFLIVNFALLALLLTFARAIT